MEVTFLDERLRQTLADITSNVPTCLYRHECYFLNSKLDLKISAKLYSVTIFQDFVNAYLDTIQIEVELVPGDYRTLMNSTQDLECCIILYPVDNDAGSDLYEKEPIVLQYSVFTEKQIDMDKQYQSNVFGDNAQDGGTILSASQAQAYGRFTFHLISKDMRDIRKIQLNMIGREVELNSVLHWACQQFKAENVIIIPPDNKAVIDNFVIPPMKDISTLFPYLQQRYGIYKKGLGYYYTDNTMYVYPQYDTSLESSPDTKGVVHIINGVRTYFNISSYYHKREGDDLYIAAAHYLNVAPVNTASSENNGDNIVTTNADMMLDRLAPVGGDGSVSVINNQTVIRRQNSATNMSSDSQSVKYGDVTSNIYVTTSNLAMEDGSILNTIWVNAEPMSIKPGQHLVYNYTSNDGDYKSSEGKILGVVYHSISLGVNSTKPIIRFNAYIRAFIESEKQSAQEYMYNT